MLMRQVFVTVCSLVKNLTFQGDIYHGGIKSKQQVMVLLACIDDGSDKLPELVMGCLCSCKTLKYFPKHMIAT